MIQKHNNLMQCPYCDENISSIFYNSAQSGTLTRLKHHAICKKCFRIYRISIQEVQKVEI